jgi:hypothetical protein
MKRVTITLEFEENDSEYIGEHSGGVDIGLLLRDALGEFEAVRTPANEYVDKRYGSSMPGPATIAFKIRDVEKRCEMARVLGRTNVTIFIGEGANPGTYQQGWDDATEFCTGKRVQQP